MSLTWEDPHLLAVREEEEAARRRAKRAEIANKYSTSATDGDDGVSTGMCDMFHALYLCTVMYYVYCMSCVYTVCCVCC